MTIAEIPRKEIRCPHKLFAVLIGDMLEIKCRSSFCGASPGVVVIHQFDCHTGEYIETRTFREPQMKGMGNV